MRRSPSCRSTCVLVEARETATLEQPSFDERTTALANGIAADPRGARHLARARSARRADPTDPRLRARPLRRRADQGRGAGRRGARLHRRERRAREGALGAARARAPPARARTRDRRGAQRRPRRGRGADRARRAHGSCAPRGRRGRRAVLGSRRARRRGGRARLRAARADLQCDDGGAARGSSVRALHEARRDRVPAAHRWPGCGDLDAAERGRRARARAASRRVPCGAAGGIRFSARPHRADRRPARARARARRERGAHA